MKYIIGHKNPDTDAICSSLVYASYLNKKDIKNTVIKLGDLNNETQFILDKFGFSVPETVTELPEGASIILMDHNSASQSIDYREHYKIEQIIDHHKFELTTDEPLYVRAEPVGAACTIVAKMFFESGFELTKSEASLLLSAIISDTLYFRSPTTTLEDGAIMKKLNEIAQIPDLEAYSLEMFAAKSDLGDISIEKLIKLDYKTFQFGDRNFGIGVMETTNPDYGFNRKDEIIAKLKDIKQADNLDGILFSIIDILNKKNTTFFPDEFEAETIDRVFGVSMDDHVADMGGAISRKKQMVPQLTKAF